MEKVIDIAKVMICNTKGNPLNTKYEIKEPLEIGKEYTVLLKGQVISETYLDNNDGSVNALFKICPTDIEVIKKEND
jgi:hypothetical protein